MDRSLEEKCFCVPDRHRCDYCIAQDPKPISVQGEELPPLDIIPEERKMASESFPVEMTAHMSRATALVAKEESLCRTRQLRTAYAEIKRLSQPPAGLPERPQRTSERFVSAFPVEQTEAYFAALEAEVARLKGERDRMRDLLIESGKAAGGFLLYAVSAEFLAHIPEEIRLGLSSSRADALKEALEAVQGLDEDCKTSADAAQAILAIGGGK